MATNGYHRGAVTGPASLLEMSGADPCDASAGARADASRVATSDTSAPVTRDASSEVLDDASGVVEPDAVAAAARRRLPAAVRLVRRADPRTGAPGRADMLEAVPAGPAQVHPGGRAGRVGCRPGAAAAGLR